MLAEHLHGRLNVLAQDLADKEICQLTMVSQPGSTSQGRFDSNNTLLSIPMIISHPPGDVGRSSSQTSKDAASNSQ